METLPLKKRFILSNEENKQPESSDNKLIDNKNEESNNKDEYDIDSPTTDPINIISLPYNNSHSKKYDGNNESIQIPITSVTNENKTVENIPDEKMDIEKVENSHTEISQSENLNIDKPIDIKEKDVNKQDEVKVSKKRKKRSGEKDTQKKKNKDKENEEDNQHFINIDNDFGDSIKMDDFQTIKDFEDEELSELYDRLSESSKEKLFKETIKQNPTNIILWYRLADSINNINEAINYKMQMFEKDLRNAISIQLDTMQISNPNYISNLCSESFISQKENRNENLALNDVVINTLLYIEKVLKKCHEYIVKGKLKLALLMFNLIINNYIQSSICKDRYITSDEEEKISNLFIRCLKNLSYIKNMGTSFEEIHELLENFEKCLIYDSNKNNFKESTSKIRNLL